MSHLLSWYIGICGVLVTLTVNFPKTFIMSSVFINILNSASFPSHGWAPVSPARLSLSSVDETTEAKSGSSVGDEHQWMVS